jgi:hypothetical protein
MGRKSGKYFRFEGRAKAARTVSSLNGLAGVHENLNAQIAAVPPAAADSGTVGSWLNYLREEAGFERGVAASLAAFKIRQFQSQLRQADQALRSSQVAIAGFGFQVCGVAGLLTRRKAWPD